MPDSTDSWRKPLFADILRGIRLSSTVYFRPQLRAPWGIRISAPAQATVFHIIVSGSAWLEVSEAPKPVELSAGDFVVVMRGCPHIMRDDRATPATDLFDLLRCNTPDKDKIFHAGGAGPITRMVCGGMHFDNGATDPLLAVLPPFIHVKAKSARPWLRSTVDQVVAELNSGGAGSDEVATRLSDILFIQAVRAHFEENADSAEAGWLAGARDKHIGRALALLHGQPDQPWTVGSLARRVAFSRSAFADRFSELVGEPPLRYLTRLRINTAAKRLRSSDDKLTVIAADVGYESVSAFNRVFKRHLGMTPGEYRDSRRSGVTEAGDPSEE